MALSLIEMDRSSQAVTIITWVKPDSIIPEMSGVPIFDSAILSQVPDDGEYHQVVIVRRDGETVRVWID